MPNYLAVFQSGGITEIEKRYVAKELMLLGDKTAEYGITLSEKDCVDIAECRYESLKENERIEVGLGATQRIIEEFCDSGYVSQSNFRETVEGLLECFYMIKTETEDKVSDDEVLEFLKYLFEYEAGGDVSKIYDSVALDAFIRDKNSFTPGSGRKDEDYT